LAETDVLQGQDQRQLDNVEPEQEIHKAIEADEDEESSEESSNKSSDSSEIEEENDIVNEDEDTPQDILDNDQPAPVTRTRSGRTQRPGRFVEDMCLRPSPRKNKSIFIVRPKLLEHMQRKCH
jgi:hypothetical protein